MKKSWTTWRLEFVVTRWFDCSRALQMRVVGWWEFEARELLEQVDRRCLGLAGGLNAVRSSLVALTNLLVFDTGLL